MEKNSNMVDLTSEISQISLKNSKNLRIDSFLKIFLQTPRGVINPLVKEVSQKPSAF